MVFFRIIDNLRQACETLKIDNLVANMLIENMHEIAYLIYDESQKSIHEMFEENSNFKTKLIKQFFFSLDNNYEIKKAAAFQNGDDRNTLITRITKIILWNGGDIDIDEDLFNNMPINSSNPLHIAGDCFRDVLKECGVPDDKADLARKAFICLKLSTFDEVRDRLFRIAS
jgi:hypothetical protein